MSLVNLLLLIEVWLERWENEYEEEIDTTEKALEVLQYIDADFIVEDLGCNFRTAYDYKNAILALVNLLKR